MVKNPGPIKRLSIFRQEATGPGVCRIAHRPGSRSRISSRDGSALSGLGLPAACSVRLSAHRADLQPLPASSVSRVTLAGQGVFPATHPGLEPGTKSLTGSCSTAELIGQLAPMVSILPTARSHTNRKNAQMGTLDTFTQLNDPTHRLAVQSAAYHVNAVFQLLSSMHRSARRKSGCIPMSATAKLSCNYRHIKVTRRPQAVRVDTI